MKLRNGFDKTDGNYCTKFASVSGRFPHRKKNASVCLWITSRSYNQQFLHIADDTRASY